MTTRRPRRRPDRGLDRARRPGALRRRGGRVRPRSGDARRARSSSVPSIAAADRVAEACAGADVVFCAAPVAALPALARAALEASGPETVVTDVGSTKRDLVAALGDDERFIGGHPLAGAETAGVENARADLFDGARWYLTPTERSSGLLYDAPAAGRRRPRRPTAGDRRRCSRPADGDRQSPSARGRQRPRRPGGGGADPGLGADAGGRPELPRRDQGRGLEPGDLGRHLRQQPRRRRGGDRGHGESAARRRRADPRRRPRRARRLAQRRGDERRRLQEAESAAGRLRELRVVVANRPGTVAELALALGDAGVNIEDMALHPAPDMRSGAVSLWVAGDEQADRALELVRGLGHTATVVGVEERYRWPASTPRVRCGGRCGRRPTSRSPIARR